jgi:hypothetical protein
MAAALYDPAEIGVNFDNNQDSSTSSSSSSSGIGGKI